MISLISTCSFSINCLQSISEIYSLLYNIGLMNSRSIYVKQVILIYYCVEKFDKNGNAL